MSDDDDTFSFADEYNSFGDELTGKAYPKGSYEMRVKNMVPKVTSGQKRSFVVTLEFTKGPHRGKTVTEQMTWSPESDVAARIFAQGLKIMGASQDWIKTNKPTPQQIANQCIGSLVEVVLTEDTWQGQDRNRVRFNKNLGKAAPVPGLGSSDDDLGLVDMGGNDDNGDAEDLSDVSLDDDEHPDHPGGLEEFAPPAGTNGDATVLLAKVPAGSVPASDDDEGLDWP